jgi:hypothetical protein
MKPTISRFVDEPGVLSVAIGTKAIHILHHPHREVNSNLHERAPLDVQQNASP